MNHHSSSNTAFNPTRSQQHRRNVEELRRQGGEDHRRRQQRMPGDDARDITTSLSRTRTLLARELERTELASRTVQEDGTRLSSTKSDQHVLADLTGGARNALTTLRRQENREALVFASSLIFFYTVVLYVLWTRVSFAILLTPTGTLFLTIVIVVVSTVGYLATPF